MSSYAGIGSRETPEDILHLMSRISAALEKQGWTLRSGGAVGADTAFESSAKNKQIFLAADCTQDAMELSSRYHPTWQNLGPYVKKLHGRNAMIILGAKLDDPVDFLVCWTPRGAVSGGTGQGIRIAKDHRVPIVNLFNEREKERFLARWGMI